MKTYLRLILPLIILSLTFTGYGQEAKTQKYETGFIFKKGIYLTFENFKDNNPIPSEDIVSEFNRESSDFFRRVILNKKMSHITKDYDTTTINAKDAWGYSDGVNVYARTKEVTSLSVGQISKEWSKPFSPEKMTVIGSYCIFKGKIKMDHNNLQPSGSLSVHDQNLYLVDKYLVNCLMDFKTGEVKELSTKNVLEILKLEPTLYAEYKKSKLKKSQRNYVFIMKYNERNPIYFPVTNFE